MLILLVKPKTKLKHLHTIIVLHIEPLKLSVDMEHYLNVIKEISVTDSFLSSNELMKGCQEEPTDECTTRKYKTTILNQCNCLPFQLGLNDKVLNISHWATATLLVPE